MREHLSFTPSRFRNLIAQREGRRKAKDGEEENGEENGEEDNDNIFEGEE
jgi:hypothetical protein